LSEEKKNTLNEIDTFDKILADIYHCLETYKKTGDAKIFYKEFIKLFHVNIYLFSDISTKMIRGSKSLERKELIS